MRSKKERTNESYRQGDVFIKRIAKIPKTAKVKSNTVALGEVTGHHHTFDDGAVVYGDGAQQYVQVRDTSVITHQEHAPITIEKGLYEVVIQREYDLVEGNRRVMD